MLAGEPFRRIRILCVLFLLISAVPIVAQSTAQMPTIEGESLSGSKVVLPEAAKGKVATLIFGFTRASKEATKAWADKIFADFDSRPGFALYQLPVLEAVPGFIRGMVVSSMKKGVRENMRKNFVPILHHEAELKKLVSFKEPDDAYLVVLDRSGQIVHQQRGPFSDAAYAQLKGKIEPLFSSPK